jgi:hypothetical protein
MLEDQQESLNAFLRAVHSQQVTGCFAVFPHYHGTVSLDFFFTISKRLFLNQET